MNLGANMKILIILSITLISCTPKYKNENVGQRLNQLRESMSSSIQDDEKITPKVFKRTCGSVKKRIQKYKKRGIKVVQISHKNRNPKHAIPKHLKSTYQEFMDNSELTSKEITLKNRTSILYRINVKESCLKCHGEVRPNFIQKKYPMDKAYDFKSGDLRGLYIINKS